MSGRADEPIRAVIFDLGGVLVETNLERTGRAWAEATGLGLGQVEACFADLEPFFRLERGELTMAECHTHVVERLGRPLTRDDFLGGWNAILGPVLPGVEALLDDLAGQTRLAVLSNTNAAHAERFEAMYGPTLARFERVFLSFRLGSRKPEPPCYLAALAGMDLSPREAAFIDDRPDNVRAAADLGLHAILAEGAPGIRRDLAALGLPL